MSYLEKWFNDEVIVKYKLNEIYDIKNEHSIYPYFIDFAFLNIKLAVELDGQCHFTNGNKRIDHDFKKDKDLIAKEWKVYRIKYDELNDKTINDFLNFLNGINGKKG